MWRLTLIPRRKIVGATKEECLERLLHISPERSKLVVGECAADLESVLAKECREFDGLSLELAAAGLPPHTYVDITRAVERSRRTCWRLDLSENGLGDETAGAIAGFVARQQAGIRELNLRSNNITAIGLTHLCVAFAGHQDHAYPLLEGGRCVPAWLDLHDNRIDDSSELLKVLHVNGIFTCKATKCSAQRCIMAAPVHVVGLGSQEEAIHCDRKELLDLLGPARAPREVKRPQNADRKFIPVPLEKSNMPNPSSGLQSSVVSSLEHQSSEHAMPSGGGHIKAPAEISHTPLAQPTVLTTSHEAAAIVQPAPPLESRFDNPLGQNLQDLETGVPRLFPGQLVQATKGFAAYILKVKSAPALLFWGVGRVEVTWALQCGEDQWSAWLDVREVVPEPLQ